MRSRSPSSSESAPGRSSHPSRRRFLAGSAALALPAMPLVVPPVARSLGRESASSRRGSGPVSGPRRKAVKLGMVDVEGSLADRLTLLRDLGFDGVEPQAPADWDPAELKSAADAAGLEIHGLVGSQHWGKPLSSPDREVRDAGREALAEAVRLAPQVGASTVLLVPAVVNEGISYSAAWDRSVAEIRKVLPLCRELSVQIAIENVWNNFLLSPLEAALYVDTLNEGFELENGEPAVGFYFDAGNLVRYGWPLHWIEALGSRILKVDVKDYSRKKQNESGPWSGFGVGIGEGDTGWPEIVAALDGIGYEGWYTAEVRGGDEARLRQIAERMDAFLKTD